MWQEAGCLQAFGTQIRTLSGENTILFTCLHGAKHGWRQLKWIADLAYACRSLSAIDWEALLNLAKARGLLRQVFLGLLLAEEFYAIGLPLNIRRIVQADRYAGQLAFQVINRLFARVNNPGLFADYGFYLRSRERFIDRAYYLYDMILLPKQIDWLTLPLPETMYPLYYIFRPLRLLYLMGRAAVSALF